MKNSYFRGILGFFFIFFMAPLLASAQSGVSFGSTTTTNHFPDSMVFESSVTSQGSPIVKAEFVSYLDRYGASDSTTREKITIQPGQNVALSYTWDTKDATVIPWEPIVYHWKVTDADGATYESEPESVRYADNRFEWKERKNNEVIVLWHNKPDVFGDKVFEIAQKAIQRQRKLFGVTLGIPIRIIVYNRHQEFGSWHSVALDWVGGEAFPPFGITTQIVTSRLPDSHWLTAVVPHEISHLYLYQAAYNPTAPIPAWLNEGIAQYNQFTDDGEDYRVTQAARADKLIPLTSLAAGFGSYDEDRIRLSYAEGLSAVRYLVQTYGEAGLSRLLQAYKQGLPTDEAFKAALGVDMGAFQQDWAVSLGASREAMITPTPWPLPTFPPSPTPNIVLKQTRTPTPENVSQSAVNTPTTPTSAPTATKAPASPTPAPTATAPDANKRSSPFCPGLFLLLPLPLLAVFLQRRHAGRR